jgi:hypothetical protein
MEERYIDAAVEKASRAAQKAGDHKSEAFLAVLLAALLRGHDEALGRTVVEGPPIEGKPTPHPAKPLSPGEFFAAREWSTEVDKVVLAGSFLERYSSVSSYTVQQIRNCLLSAKVSLPKNVNLAVFQAVQRGWMMEVPAENVTGKAWSLTQTGERRVEEMANPSGN